MAKHVMIDLETLSKRTNAVITQLAAVAFDSETGEILSRFNAFVKESLDLSASDGHLDVDTVAWWLTQKAAPELGAALLEQGRPLSSVLSDFVAWFIDQDHRVGLELRQGAVEGVWSHGATFDLPILTSAFERCEYQIAVPWGYRLPRDTRTLYALAPGGMPTVAVDETRKHDALYDCEVQVQQVVGALKALRLQAQAAGLTSRTLEQLRAEAQSLTERGEA